MYEQILGCFAFEREDTKACYKRKVKFMRLNKNKMTFIAYTFFCVQPS